MADHGRRPLRSLAHPLPGGDARSPGAPVRTLPHVDSHWGGFCLPALHCLGIRRDVFERRSEEPQWLRLYTYHETLHWMLANTWVVGLMWLCLKHIYQALLVLSTDEEIAIGPRKSLTVRQARTFIVPFVANPRGHYIERWVSLVEAIHDATEAVQEAFAVWASLWQAQRDGAFSSEDLDRIREDYMTSYSDIPGFSHLYSHFERFATDLARIAGIDAVCKTVGLAMETALPSSALDEMVHESGHSIRAIKPAGTQVDLFISKELFHYRQNNADTGLLRLIPVIESLVWSTQNIQEYASDLPEHPFFTIFDERRVIVLDRPLLTEENDRQQENEVTERNAIADNLWLESVFEQCA